MPIESKKILILCKTYPSPSSKYAETSCVAGLAEDGQLIRIYPIPFRLLDGDKQFQKWQWISGLFFKSNTDHRPESYKVKVDTIRRDGKPLPTTNEWGERRGWLERLKLYNDFNELEQARREHGVTLALLRPDPAVELEVVPEKTTEWTSKEAKKLTQMQKQDDLFDTGGPSDFHVLRKLPIRFYYKYMCGDTTGIHRHKIVDWEIGALYWNLRKAHGDSWESHLRHKYEREFSNKDLMFLMGTIHRFPDQWLIISVIYPPKRRHDKPYQIQLL